MQRQSTRRLGVESLETRDLMAGNVIAHVIDGNLVVRGDSQSNYVAITATATPNRFKVEGIGCSINNESSVLVNVTGITNIRLDGGNDRLKLGTNTSLLILPGALKVSMGTGSDIVAVDRVRGTDAAFSLGQTGEDDADSVTLNRSVFTGNTSLLTGDGDDKVIVNSSEVTAYLRVDAGDGGDELSLTNATAGKVNITCGAGNDDLSFAGLNTFTGEVSISGGDDNDHAHEATGTSYEISDTSPRLSSFEVENVTFG